MPEQQEFLFIDTRSELAPNATPADSDSLTEDTLIEEIRATWRMPFLRQKVRVTLRGCDVYEITGHLEIASPFPDYPFKATQPLHLRIGDITFTPAQITSCALL